MSQLPWPRLFVVSAVASALALVACGVVAQEVAATSTQQVAIPRACEDYVACALDTNVLPNDEVSAVLDLYGNGGSCYEASSMERCTDACQDGIREINDAANQGDTGYFPVC